MTERYDETDLDEEDVARVKADLKTEAAKQWRYYSVAKNPVHAVRIANVDPPQQAGEAVFSVREDGTVHLFLFY